MVLDVVDCTNRLHDNKKKDESFIVKLCLPFMEKLDKAKNKIDIINFNDESKMQLA